MDIQKPIQVKKPMNAFFIYRKYNQKRIIKMYKVSKSQEISKIAGQYWSLESDHIKKHYYQLAMIEQIRKENEQAVNHQSELISPLVTFHQSQLLSPPISPLDFSLVDDVNRSLAGVSPDIQIACESVDYNCVQNTLELNQTKDY
ncbi:hypothetical protein BC833DRAFT_609201 [Globomyces pollinis-pini]|nr:hypothetical protein BC833DRAFT_609201 [Globomyces pollinis-pini]